MKEYTGKTIEWGTIQHKDTMELRRYWVLDYYPSEMVGVAAVESFSDAMDRESMSKNWIFYPNRRIEDVFFE